MYDSAIGIVLAGGASRRLGRDKAAVWVGGDASLARVKSAVAAVVGKAWVVGGARGDIADLEPGGGPLQAILAGSRAKGPGSVIVAACDMPLVDEDTIRALASPLAATVEARVPEVDGRLQWLAAHYGRQALARLETAWMAGERSLTRAMAGATLDTLGPWNPRAFRDFDTEADLAEVLALASSAG
jgi:molybdopterin-guanine dinucleotide biosynthesis protein A